jgi:catechol 2,3-dioxygenase-like lactoylglutathione lyase family enzyme
MWHSRQCTLLPLRPVPENEAMLDTLPPLGLQRVKIVALAVADLNRANQFYGRQLGFSPAFEGGEQVGWWLDAVILMLKPDWAAPTNRPNPRVTLATEHAPATQDALRARGIVIADEVRPYGDFYVGSFLDSEGNKLWFCSPVAA